MEARAKFCTECGNPAKYQAEEGFLRCHEHIGPWCFKCPTQATHRIEIQPGEWHYHACGAGHAAHLMDRRWIVRRSDTIDWPSSYIAATFPAGTPCPGPCEWATSPSVVADGE